MEEEDKIKESCLNECSRFFEEIFNNIGIPKEQFFGHYNGCINVLLGKVIIIVQREDRVNFIKALKGNINNFLDNFTEKLPLLYKEIDEGTICQNNQEKEWVYM